VITALVVVEFPTTRLTMLARVATSDEKNPLVDVLLVVDALVAKRLVAVALVRLAFVLKRFVTVPTVVEDVLSTVCPDTERLVAVVVASVEVPVTKVLPATVRAVVDASPSDAVDEKRLVAVSAVADAVVRVV
jgi:hypothetical protein